MIFRYLDLLDISFPLFLAFFGSVLAALLLGIVLHEFSHALAAYALGDHTAYRLGRLSLNPKVHLDPVGTAMLFLIGFGWGKPVPFNPYDLRNGPRAGMATVAAAGPFSNLVMASLLAVPIKLGWLPWHNPFAVFLSVSGWQFQDYIGLFLGSAVLLNVILAVFNLIPLFPLDGFRIAVGVLPPDLSRSLAELERYGPAILIALLALPFLTGVNPLSEVMVPAVEGITGVLTGV